MKRSATSTIAALKVWSAMLVIGLVAHAGLPYLPLLGPTPLRLQPTTSSSSTATFKYVGPPAPVVTNALVVAESKNPAAATNVSAVRPAGSAVNPADDDEGLGDAFTTSVFSLPAPDLLGISPEMLATYFRPVPTGSNSVSLFGPFHVSFTPPLAPDSSSHAKYIVK